MSAMKSMEAPPETTTITTTTTITITTTGKRNNDRTVVIPRSGDLSAVGASSGSLGRREEVFGRRRQKHQHTTVDTARDQPPFDAIHTLPER